MRHISPGSIPFDLQRVRSFLHVRRNWNQAAEFEALAHELHEQSLPYLHPAYQYVMTPVEDTGRTDSTVRLAENTVFRGEGICHLLQAAPYAAPFVLTLGTANAFTALQDSDLIRSFVLDGVLSSLAAGVLQMLRNELAMEGQKRSCALTYRYAPGYARWQLEDQRPLFGLFAPEMIGLCLTDDFVMIPRHSLSGVFGFRSIV